MPKERATGMGWRRGCPSGIAPVRATWAPEMKAEVVVGVYGNHPAPPPCFPHVHFRTAHLLPVGLVPTYGGLHPMILRDPTQGQPRLGLGTRMRAHVLHEFFCFPPVIHSVC